MTHGEHYLKGLHKPAFLKASKAMLILPFLAICLCSTLYFSAGTQYRENVKFETHAKTDLPNLVKNLAYNLVPGTTGILSTSAYTDQTNLRLDLSPHLP